MLESLVRPEVEFRFLMDLVFQSFQIALCDGIGPGFFGLFFQQEECRLVNPAFHLLGLKIEHRIIHLSGDGLGTDFDRDLDIQKSVPVLGCFEFG